MDPVEVLHRTMPWKPGPCGVALGRQKDDLKPFNSFSSGVSDSVTDPLENFNNICSRVTDRTTHDPSWRTELRSHLTNVLSL